MHTGTRRVGYYHVGASVFGHKIGSEHIFHIAGKKERVVDAVQGGVHLGIGYGFGHIFYADNAFCRARHKVGNGAGAGVEVVHQFVAGECGKGARHLIEFVGLLRVGLVERFRPDFEPRPFHRLVNGFAALEQMHLLVGDGVVAFAVDDVQQRRNFGESLRYMFQQRHPRRLVVVEKDQHQHQLARRGGTYHHCTQKSALLAQVEELQSVRQRITFYLVAQAIVNVVLQPAFANVEHFVEHARNVKSHAIQVACIGIDYFVGHQPAAVRKGVFQLVAVAVNLF